MKKAIEPLPLPGFLSLVVLLFYACNPAEPGAAGGNETVHSTATDTIVTNAKPIRLEGCYRMILQRDTANLSIMVKDSTVTGTLQYRWYDNDRNEGTIQGVLRNDIIIADYNFESEGVTSVREVVFRVAPDGYLEEGFGELQQANGKTSFRNKDGLQFMHAFLPVPCNNP